MSSLPYMEARCRAEYFSLLTASGLQPRLIIRSMVVCLFSMAAYMSGVLPVTGSHTSFRGLGPSSGSPLFSKPLRAWSQPDQSPLWDRIRTWTKVHFCKISTKEYLHYLLIGCHDSSLNSLLVTNRVFRPNSS